MELNTDFIKLMHDTLPGSDAQALVQALASTQPQVAVRVNPSRGASVPSGASLVPWCSLGYYLSQPVQFTFDTDFHAGRYYVQDASSMFICHVIKSLITQPVRYLDLCAAPGGKTTAALDALPAGSTVWANEVVASRALTLADNVVKWGSTHCIVTSDAPSSYGKLYEQFDVIAADVPCSGEGMMRKDEQAAAQWSPTLVEQCVQRQRGIIADVWPALRPGGILIYSTCTFNRAENEEMLEHIVSTSGATPIEVPVHPEWRIHAGIGTAIPCYRFMPHLTRGEGLFMAALRKPGAYQPPHNAKPVKPRKPTKQNCDAARLASPMISCPKDYIFAESNGIITALPASMQADAQLARHSLHVMRDALVVGAAKGKACVPSHELALSTALASNAFSTVEVDYATAIAYLRGEALRIDAPRGYVVITHRGANLGFANNLGTRANNMYPKPLRILSTHIPQHEPHALQ